MFSDCSCASGGACTRFRMWKCSARRTLSFFGVPGTSLNTLRGQDAGFIVANLRAGPHTSRHRSTTPTALLSTDDKRRAQHTASDGGRALRYSCRSCCRRHNVTIT